MAVVAAFPYIQVTINTSALQPVAQRSPGVIAVVGTTPNGANGGAAAVNTPQVVDTLADAATLFAKVTNKVVAPTTLYQSLVLALLQDPKPQKIYGVRVDGTNYAAALASLEAVDDVTLVSLANVTDIGTKSAGNNAATGLQALKEHVDNMSAAGQKRLGVAMVDPATGKTPTYVDDLKTLMDPLRSDSSRMVMMAARGADSDVATAATAAIAGYEPQISMVLKRVRGVRIPLASQYSPSEIKGLSEAGLNPIIDPTLIVGSSLHFGDGRTFTTDDSMLFIDIVRVLDDIDFRLKAGLIGSVGDARITKAGMTLVKSRVEGILGPLQRRAVIDNFDVQIPVLDILSLPESAWSSTDENIVVTARANRTVEMFVSITYGPAVHRMLVTLAPKF
jgi:hypothetical protein